MRPGSYALSGGQSVRLRIVADYSADGPLLLGPNPETDFNQIAARAESGLPEGAYVQVEIDSVTGAAQAIGLLNGAYQAGNIKNPQTGEEIKGWPDYPGQIAFPFNGGNGLILRYVKGQPWLPVLIVVLAALIVVIVLSLERSAWRIATPASGQGSGAPPVGLTSGKFIWFGVGPRGTFRILDLPWYWVAGGAGLGLLAALATREAGAIEEGEAAFLRGRRDIRKAREG